MKTQRHKVKKWDADQFTRNLSGSFMNSTNSIKQRALLRTRRFAKARAACLLREHCAKRAYSRLTIAPPPMIMTMPSNCMGAILSRNSSALNRAATIGLLPVRGEMTDAGMRCMA